MGNSNSKTDNGKVAERQVKGSRRSSKGSVSTLSSGFLKQEAVPSVKDARRHSDTKVVTSSAKDRQSSGTYLKRKGEHRKSNNSASASMYQCNGKRGSFDRKDSSTRPLIELPSSMVIAEPKSPILKCSSSVSSVFANNEEALTDDDFSEEGQHKSNSRSSRRSSQARPSSSREGSFSAKARRKSDNYTDSIGTGTYKDIMMARSNSQGSEVSKYSGKFSDYTTPPVSPSIRSNIQSVDDDVPIKSLNSDGSYAPSSKTNSTRNSRSTSGKAGNYLTPTSLGTPGEKKLSSYLSIDSNEFEELHRDSTEPKIKKSPKLIDLDEIIQRLLDAGYAAKRSKNVCVKNYEILQICHKVRNIFLNQPPILELMPPVKIVGDVHGQYSDLLRLFTKCGFPPTANYLFLGDYVDRGKQSLETILLLFCYKIKYPENFFLLRGNHECASVTRVYGFYDECKRRCNIKTWKLFIDVFNTLPLAAIVTGKIFCVHGGLSPVLNSMDELRLLHRPTDVPDFGLINDLLWSDPIDSPNEWEDNERGVSYCYNKVAINKFLNKFGFDLICRAHMVVEDGYEFFNNRSLVTVFSAPNYCGEFDNWGGVMIVSEGLLCSFELLDPLDRAALKQVMKKGRQERKTAVEQFNNEIESNQNNKS